MPPHYGISKPQASRIKYALMIIFIIDLVSKLSNGEAVKMEDSNEGGGRDTQINKHVEGVVLGPL